MLGYELWFRPTIPGWALWCACVCLGSGFGCARPFLAGVLRCVCVFVCPLHLYPANPGTGARCGCVCFGSGFGCAQPLLAGVLGSVCVVCALLLYPANPGWGVRCGCVCLGFVFGCSSPYLAGVLGCVCVFVCALFLAGVRAVSVCAWAQASTAPCHSWLGCWGLCVFMCALLVYPANHYWGVRCGCVCLGSGFGCALPFLARVLGCVCVIVCALRLHSAKPGWGARCGSVCLGSGFGCTPPLLTGVLGSVCVCVPPPPVSRQSWLGCAVWLCVPGLRFRLRPPYLAGVLGCLYVCVRAPPVLRQSWLECAVSMCVLGLGFRLRPAIAGWGAGVCVWLCARSACTPQILARLRGVGVCAWARLSAAPRQSWLGRWGLCVFVCALLPYLHSTGWGVRCGCVCLGSGFGCAPLLRAGVFGCVCRCAPSACTPPFLGGF